MRIYFALFFALIFYQSKAQNIDSLFKELGLDTFKFDLLYLGIDTTAEIVPDTLYLTIPDNIASDTAYARKCFYDAIEMIKVRNYDEAYAKADTAKHIFQIVIGFVSKDVADCLHEMGIIRQNQYSFNDAIIFFKKSGLIRIRIFREINISVAASYNQIGSCLISKGEHDKAINFFQKALIIRFKKLGPDHHNIGASFNNLGVCYINKGEFDKAKKLTQKALEIRIKTLGVDHPDVGASYNNLGIANKSKGEYEKAITYFKKVLRIRLNYLGPDHREVGNSYNNLGVIYESKGEYDKAIEFYKKALKIRLSNLGPNHPDVARVYTNFGNSFDAKGEYDKAIEFTLKALYILKKRLGSDHPDIGLLYHNLGSSFDSKGEYNNAIEFLQKGLNIRLKAFGTDHLEVGDTYNNLGVTYDESGEYNKAIDYKQKALDIRIKTFGIYHPNVGASYNNLGVTYSKMGDINKALGCMQKALTIRIKTLDPNHRDILSTNFKLFNIHLNLNQLDSSLFYIHQAISGIKSQMASDISLETKNLYQAQNVPVFESTIDVSLIKSKQDQHDSLKLKTYEYTELAKASLLQSQIKQTDALAFAGIPDSLLQKEYDLRIDINWREKQRQGLMEKGKTETDTTVLRISSIIFDLKREQETLFETLEKDYPEYYRLKYDTKTISLEDTQQKLLKDGQTMLEYFVGDSSIFIFVVRPDTFDVVQVKKDFPLDSLVRQIQSGIFGYYGQSADKRTDNLYKNTISDYTYAAYVLYQRIMAPVAHLLTSDLVIIPDGVLGYVPFEALLKSKPEKLNQFGTYPYLINDHTISYNYSATLWNEMKSKKHKKEPAKSLVAFAPFYEGSYTVLDSTINLVFDTLSDGRDTTIFQDVVSRKTYSPLPSSGIEAGTVSKMWKGDFFINQDATEQKFYDVAGDYRIVHLSTHGIADARQGDYSYLAFAEIKDSIENEFLYVRDIYNTQLNADLVFLSACETAQGELQRGEGIISLARAFAYAGAKSIITTLWQVDDSATKDISIDFYKNLKKGFTKDVALRQAKLRHIKSARSAQKHPFFWAAMIGIGDMGIVK